MEDDRDFIERTQSRAKHIEGRELSPSELARELTKLSPTDRVEQMERLEADRSEISRRDMAKRLPYVRALRSTHETLRKIGR